MEFKKEIVNELLSFIAYIYLMIIKRIGLYVVNM